MIPGGLFGLYKLKMLDSPQSIDVLLKCVLAIAAAFFFLYKIIAGWLIMNMSVSIRTDRQRRDKDSDHLAVAIVLEKGSTDSVHIIDIRVRVTNLQNQNSIRQEQSNDETVYQNEDVVIAGFTRLEDTDRKASWNPSSRRDRLAISPGEKVEYAAYTPVPHDAPVLISVVVLGDRWLSKTWNGYYNQWRVSALSLPLADDGKCTNKSSSVIPPFDARPSPWPNAFAPLLDRLLKFLK